MYRWASLTRRGSSTRAINRSVCSDGAATDPRTAQLHSVALPLKREDGQRVSLPPGNRGTTAAAAACTARARAVGHHGGAASPSSDRHPCAALRELQRGAALPLKREDGQRVAPASPPNRRTTTAAAACTARARGGAAPSHHHHDHHLPHYCRTFGMGAARCTHGVRHAPASPPRHRQKSVTGALAPEQPCTHPPPLPEHSPPLPLQPALLLHPRSAPWSRVIRAGSRL